MHPARLIRFAFVALSLSIALFLTAFSGAMIRSDSGRVVARSENAAGGSVAIQSPAYSLDEVYMSMQGPRSNQPKIRMSMDADPGETIWLTGVESNVVDASSLEPVSNEFFCHSNLTLNPETINPEQHNASFAAPTHADWRFFTLVPGRMSVQLPEGFGLPVKNATLLDYYTMALNQNPGMPDREIRMQTRLDYRRAEAGQQPPKPLFRRALYVYQQHKSSADDAKVPSAAQQEKSSSLASRKTHAIDAHQGEFCAETCTIDQSGRTPSRFGSALDLHPGATCCVLNASADGVVAQFGDENTVHWMVPPGKHQYRTEVTEQMQLPFDTTAHYVTGHLHPFGKSLRLIDLETGDIVFDISARSMSDRLGVQWMSESKYPEGVSLHQNHRYELIAEYDNTLDRPIDAMGILYVYALDQHQ